MLQLLLIRWDWPLHHSSDLLWICLHATPLNDKAQERDTVSVELALFLFLRVSGDQNVINAHKHKPVEEISEDVIHQGLKHSLGVCESEGHDQVLKMS